MSKGAAAKRQHLTQGMHITLINPSQNTFYGHCIFRVANKAMATPRSPPSSFTASRAGTISGCVLTANPRCAAHNKGSVYHLSPFIHVGNCGQCGYYADHANQNTRSTGGIQARMLSDPSAYPNPGSEPNAC